MQKIIYLPGWLNSRDNLAFLTQTVGGDFDVIELMAPDKVMSVPEYAEMIVSKITEPVYIAGHSFGGKVAIAIAAMHPEKVKGIFVISGSNQGKLIFRILRPAVKLAKFLGFSGARFQVSDYKNSSPVLKKVMQKTLDFNIIPLARRVKVPATFIYGANDTVTPPKLGKKLARAAHGKFFELPGFNHNSIISDGAFQVASIIKSSI
jgi:pimeloyl-ACP methyl ester carboxylesterase